MHSSHCNERESYQSSDSPYSNGVRSEQWKL